MSAERLRAYSVATGETDERHLRGLVAPPVYAFVAIWEAVIAAQRSVLPDTVAPTVPRLHGEQDLFLHAQVEAGMRLHVRVAPVGFHGRSTGAILVLRGETRDAGGNLINHQYTTTFLPGLRADLDVGENPPPHRADPSVRVGPPTATSSGRIEMDQPGRYAEASGDFNPIHLDERVARSQGLGGTIAHGMCTLAVVARGIVETICRGEPARLGRLAARLSRPVRPGDALATKLWMVGGEQAAFAFETETRPGEVVLTDGLAEVRPAA